MNSFLYHVTYDTETEEFHVTDMKENKEIGTFPDMMECGSYFYSYSRLNDNEKYHMTMMLEEISDNVKYINGWRVV